MLFMGIDTKISKLTQESKGSERAKIIIDEEGENFSICYKTTVIKTTLYWHREPLKITTIKALRQMWGNINIGQI